MRTSRSGLSECLLMGIVAVSFTACCTSRSGDGSHVPISSPVRETGEMTTIDLDLTDEERNREVPIRIHLPEDRESPLPLVFVSHGIGESRESYEWLGRAIASNGYVVIHPTHRGTDREKLEEGFIAMYRATRNPENWINRARDVSFILDHLDTLGSVEHRLANAIDSERVGVVGHSAGAWTAAAVGGLELAGGENLRDPRVDAIAPLSMPRTGSVDSPAAWASLVLPALHMTGTCDNQIIWWTFASDRRIPWENGKAEDQYLLTLERGRHTTFSNEWDPSNVSQSELQSLTARAVVAFLDAYVAGNDGVRDELRAGGFDEIGGDRMIVEQRPPAK